MYAIVETGGKQYRAEQGAVLNVERIEGDIGTSISLDRVLFVSTDSGTKMGNSVLANAKVMCEIVKQSRGPKIIIFKKKRRKNYRRTKGHRQMVTSVKITGFSGI
jgi:large subunit ribosomal protein L21